MTLETAHAAFRAELIDAGHLVIIGVDGLYAYGDDFQALIDGLDAHLRRRFTGNGVLSLRLPPVCPTIEFVDTGYVSSFPQLTGAVFGFTGDDHDHALLREKIAAGGDAWIDGLRPAGLMLVSAACQPVYPLFRGALPQGGRRAALLGHCFRREPSTDPARMQAFRQRELLYLGTNADVMAAHEEWIGRAPVILHGLGLPVTMATATDPFFGRAGRLLAAHQRDAGTKVELVVDLYGDGSGTALASANLHGDHFGLAFGIVAADGAPAHTGCLGFGLERLALAMLRTHGLNVGTWPTAVRELVIP